MLTVQHYDFYFFILNKNLGPGGEKLFDFSAEAPEKEVKGGLIELKDQTPIEALEGASEDPTETKVVDRRWYERNKHIYPASMWQEFDPEKDYTSEIRRDTGGNAFFYSR